MLPDRVSNPGPLTYESEALPIALRGPAQKKKQQRNRYVLQRGQSLLMSKPSQRLSLPVCLYATLLVLSSRRSSYRRPYPLMW